jgi:hypothetical protein
MDDDDYPRSGYVAVVGDWRGSPAAETTGSDRRQPAANSRSTSWTRMLHSRSSRGVLCLRIEQPPARDIVKTCGSKGAMDSHAEVRATHRRNGLRWPAHFDLRCSLAAKDVQEELARRTGESSRGLAWSNRHPLVGSGPLNLERAIVEPPTQVVAAAAHVSPQGSIHRRRKATGPITIRSANVLVVNKELVEIRDGADPTNAEETDGRAGPDPRDEPREILALGQAEPAPLGEPLERTR